MSSYLYSTQEKIDLDELYERKKEVEARRVEIYAKILKRIHEKIKITARQNIKQQFVFYHVPEIMFGLPKYDIHECIEYVIQELEKNGFIVKYTHPNLLLISWAHYVPYYERERIRKQHGVRIDKFGNIMEQKTEQQPSQTSFQVNNKKQLQSYSPQNPPSTKPLEYIHHLESSTTSTQPPHYTPFLIQHEKESTQKKEKEEKKMNPIKPEGMYKDAIKQLHLKLH